MSNEGEEDITLLLLVGHKHIYARKSFIYARKKDVKSLTMPSKWVIIFLKAPKQLPLPTHWCLSSCIFQKKPKSRFREKLESIFLKKMGSANSIFLLNPNFLQKSGKSNGSILRKQCYRWTKAEFMASFSGVRIQIENSKNLLLCFHIIVQRFCHRTR